MLTAEDLLSEDIVEEYDEPAEHEEIEEQGNEAEGEDNDETQKKTVKPKRVVRNPQPKLNEETLNGPRGISALESYFDRVKFKGSGYEEQDLSIILKTYEYWCHRLFPKYAFDECITKIERLGSKKAVQTHVKRIRLDMLQEDKPLNSEDEDDNAEFVSNDNQQFEEPVNELPNEITQEQLERIRLNREKAERIKRERLKRLEEEAHQSQVFDNNFSQQSQDDIDVGDTILDSNIQESQNTVLNSDVHENQNTVLNSNVQQNQNTALDSDVQQRQNIVLNSDVQESQNTVLDAEVQELHENPNRAFNSDVQESQILFEDNTG